MIMKVRLEAIYKFRKTKFKNAKNIVSRYNLSKRYFKFLGERSKKVGFKERAKLKFKV